MNPESIIKIQDIHLFYAKIEVLKGISLDIQEKKITSFIGPSGCGKTSLLKCINRMHDLEPYTQVKGEILFQNMPISKIREFEVFRLRKKIGMVFQKPTPFPFSIYRNITYGPQLWGITHKDNLDEIVENSLKQVYLWDDLKDRLHKSALNLSGGQQQRLSIARCLANSPEVILMDEPTSALDPFSVNKIEELVVDLAKMYTIVLVTHNLAQTARISHQVAFFYKGRLIEYKDVKTMFTNPSEKMTQKYVTGKLDDMEEEL